MYLSYALIFYIASAQCDKTESQDYDRNASIPNIGMYINIMNFTLYDCVSDWYDIVYPL